jgi:hypothetical protein
MIQAECASSVILDISDFVDKLVPLPATLDDNSDPLWRTIFPWLTAKQLIAPDHRRWTAILDNPGDKSQLYKPAVDVLNCVTSAYYHFSAGCYCVASLDATCKGRSPEEVNTLRVK